MSAAALETPYRSAARVLRNDAHGTFGVRLLQGFVLTVPFLHALSIGPWVPLPLLYALVGLLTCFVLGAALRWLFVTRSDLLLAGMILCGVAAYLTNWGYAGTKNLNHTAALITAIFLFFIWTRAWILGCGVSLERIGSAATVALIVASLSIQFEFFLVNTSGLYLADLIPYSTEDLPVAAVLEDYVRPRGLAAEPGFSAMVFEAFGPLAWLYLQTRRAPVRVLAALLVLPGFVLLFSAGAMSSLLLTAVGLALLAGRSRFTKLALILGAAALAVFVFSMSETWAWIIEQVVGRKIVALFIEAGPEAGGAASRYEAYRAAVETFLERPWGIGWGTISQMFATGIHIPGVTSLSSRGLMSLYAEIIVSAGALGFASYALFHARKLAQLARSKVHGARHVLFALLAVSIHHAFVLEFWFPMLWFLFAISDVLLRREAAARFRRPPRGVTAA